MVLSTNLSIFSIPAMFLVSYYPALKKISTLKEYKIYNNVQPRGNVAFAQAKSDIPPEVSARIARMEGAHNNGLENSPFFGLSVLAANYAGVAAPKLNIATGLYLLCRVIYNYIYINQTTPRVSGYRTLIWNISILFPFYLLISAGVKIASK